MKHYVLHSSHTCSHVSTLSPHNLHTFFSSSQYLPSLISFPNLNLATLLHLLSPPLLQIFRDPLLSYPAIPLTKPPLTDPPPVLLPLQPSVLPFQLLKTYPSLHPLPPPIFPIHPPLSKEITPFPLPAR